MIAAPRDGATGPTRSTGASSGVVLAALGLFALAGAGCHRAASDLRVWTPADHDAGTEGTSLPTPDNDDPLAAARALYAAQCVSCHGPGGRGDGPMAMMFHPADLTDPTFQRSHGDDELARAISAGKGRMPAFGSTLRPEGVALLVRLIRSWRR